jgi:hypothetical protein
MSLPFSSQRVVRFDDTIIQDQFATISTKTHKSSFPAAHKGTYMPCNTGYWLDSRTQDTLGPFSGVTTSIYRDGAYVGELKDKPRAEVVKMTLMLQS